MRYTLSMENANRNLVDQAKLHRYFSRVRAWAAIRPISEIAKKYTGIVRHTATKSY